MDDPVTSRARITSDAGLVALSERTSPDVIGRKAHALGVLAGYVPVPDGWVVPTKSTEHLLSSPSRRSGLRHSLAQVVPALLPGPVVVRSSSTLEDGRGTSLAGSFLSIKNLRTIAEVEAAVIECAAQFNQVTAQEPSSADARHRGQRLAIIVQRQVTTRVAGVCFTRHPAEGDESLGLIEFSTESVEVVCHGSGRPRTVKFDRVNHTLLDPPTAPMRATEHYEMLEKLVRDCMRLEGLFGCPLDLEWGVGDTDSTLWYFQARPITRIQPSGVNSLRDLMVSLT